MSLGASDTIIFLSVFRLIQNFIFFTFLNLALVEKTIRTGENKTSKSTS